jgi:DNA-binding beta-propeller fold protein YncE
MKINIALLILTHLLLTNNCAFAQNYQVYVSDAGNFDSPPWQILRFDQQGTNGTVFISDHLAWPQDILFLEHDTIVLIANLNTGTLSKFHSETGTYIGEFATGISGPTRMAIGPDSLLYVLQWQGNGKVKRYQLDGTFVDDFTEVGVPTSIGLDWDTAGNLYVSSYNGKFVQKFSATGANLGKIITTNLAGPTNLWIELNGDVMVADYEGAAIKRFSATGSFLGVWAGSLSRVEGIALLPNGHRLIGVGSTSSVREYSAGGTLVGNFVAPSTLGLLTPNAVVIRATGISGVKPSPVEAATLVTPSIGEQFARLEVPSHKIQRIDIYDAEGTLVTQWAMTEPVWDARNQPAGMYIMVAVMANGDMIRQKIMVSH